MIWARTERQTLGEFTVARHTFVWESDANGNATLCCDGREGPLLRGQLDRILTRPSPQDAPTDNYDVTLEDDYGFDALRGNGGDRDEATVEREYIDNTFANVRQVVTSTAGELWLRVANAGDGAAGEIELYMLERAGTP